MAKKGGKKKAAGKKKISLATKFMLVLNLIAGILLICSLAAYYVPPTYFWPIAFAGLAYPVLLVVNVFFILFWIVFLKRYFIISLIIIALGYQQFDSFVQFRSTKEHVSKKGEIKIMSFNVRLFDLYNWQDTKENETSGHNIFKLIHKESPDILCLQEYYKGKARLSRNADSVMIAGGYKYYFESFIDNGSKVLPFGIATFSRYPILSSRKEEFSNSYQNYCILTDILIGSDTIRVINTHLESIKFRKEDYIFVNELANNSTINNDLRMGSRVILSKMKNAFQKRSVQVESLANLIRSSPFRVILCADFNDTPASYSYRKIAVLQQDAFKEAGSGVGQSYAQLLPILRIDYIFTNKTMRVTSYRTIHGDLSDHYPILANVELNPK